MNNKIKEIVFDYNSHENIFTKIKALVDGKEKTFVSNVVMKIDEEKENKYFENEKIADVNFLVENFKSVYYYDRITATLETDNNKKNILNKIFSQNNEVRNVLFIIDGEEIIPFENIDTKDIDFKIGNTSSNKKVHVDNFEEVFFKADIGKAHLDLINSLRFSLVSHQITKDLINKLSRNMANILIREYSSAFNRKVSINDNQAIAEILTKYFNVKYILNKPYFSNSIMDGLDDEISIDIDEVIKLDLESEKNFEKQIGIIEQISDVKNLRNYRNYIRILESEDAEFLARTNIPLQNEIQKVKAMRFDTLLLNQTVNDEYINLLSEFYKSNNFGNICIQDNENGLHNKTLYTLAIDKTNPQLALSASLHKECKDINKVLDLRPIEDIETRKKIFSVIFSNTNENITFITDRKEDISFIQSRTKNGNFYKLDAQYLDTQKEGSLYIADVLEISYSYELNFNPLYNVSNFLDKKIIDFPSYDNTSSNIKNISNLKNKLIEKVIAQKEFNSNDTIMTGKIDSFYKYEKLFNEAKEFNIANINKEFQIIKKSDEFYSFAKSNIGKFFKGNLELIFSSFNVGKEKKVFNNDFYYNASSSISISDLDKSIALASHVSRMPTGDIISKIAKKYNIHIESNKPFSLSNPEQNKLNVGKKDFVTSSKLGAMKFGYLPKTFELKTEDREVLVDIVSTILKRNKTIDEEAANKEIETFRALLSTSSYLTLKNEQTVIDVKRFAPKEILVLIDENLKDLSKVNIPISEFYKELEDREIFNIYDYVEIAKVNSNSLDKIVSGLSLMISEFKEEQLKFKNIDKNEFTSLIQDKNIQLGERSYSAIDILISNATKEVKDKIFYDLGKQLDISAYYKTFLDFEGVNNITDWLKKQDLTAIQKNKIEILLGNFTDNEVKIVEQRSAEFFSFLEKTIGEDKQDIYQKLEEKIFKVYHDKKTENSIISKTMKLYTIETLMENSLNNLKNIDKTLAKKELMEAKSKIYAVMKKCLEITALEIMGLTVPQYEEALNFSVLKSNDMKDTQMLFWEMRQGKTRAAFASKLFTSFISSNKNLQRNLMLVQNKNLDDIAEQVVDFFPILAKDIIFNTNENIYMFKNSKSIEMPVNISKQITPQLIQLMKERIKFQGQKDSLKSDTVILANTYTKDMNQIYKMLTHVGLDDLLNKYKDSPFIEILKLTDKKKVDKDIEKSILQSFVYIQMIYERKYIKASDADFAFEKMKAFVEKVIDSKDKLKANKLSKFGIDLVPKNIMYSINVDSPITNVSVDKKMERITQGKGYIATPYEISVETKGEIPLVNIESENTKKEFAEVLENNFALPKKLKDAASDGKLYITSITMNDVDILNLKEYIVNKFVEMNIPNPTIDVQDIIESFVKQQIKDSNLVPSPIYKIDGLDEQIKDSIEINLFEILNPEKLEEFLKQNDCLQNKEIEPFIKLVEDRDSMTEFARHKNTQYYQQALNYLYDTTLSANVAKRLELISPLTAKKYKELASSFVMDIELTTNTLIYPIRKVSDDDNKKRFFYDIQEIYNENINMDNLSSNVKNEVNGLAMEFTYANSNPQFIVKREQNPELLLDLIVKRNENLNNTYTIDLKPDIANVTIDESHKGLKKNSSNLTIHDVTAYLHKITLKNNGTFTSVSGTPMSGMARDIGKIMTTGIDIDTSNSITKNIDNYCTSYEFKDDLDAMIFASIEMFPNGNVYKALEKTITIPENKSDLKLENLKLTEDEIKGIKEEISAVIKSIPNLDEDEKKELISSKTGTQSIESKFDFYLELYKTEESYRKLMDSKTIRRKDNQVKTLLVNKIDSFAKKVPGINNFATLSDIILKVGSGNSVNISRVSENARYDILDLEILKKQTETRDIKHPKSISLNNYKDKTLSFGAFLDNYKSKLKLAEVKEKVNMIFESWVIDMFNTDNLSKTVRYLGLDSKFEIKDSKSNDDNIMKINELRSRSGKSVNDSSTDIFNILYFGSEKEKYQLSCNKDLKEKVDFVISLIDKFIEFSEKYVEFQSKAKVVYENEKIAAKEQDREMKNTNFNYDGFIYDSSKYEDLNPDLERVHIFKPQTQIEETSIVTLTNDGGVLMNGTPIVFKTELNINKWENFFNGTIDINYSLTNQNESEILEYLASDSSKLYTSHLNNGENIRLMSSRNANLAISLMDSIKSLADRDNKDKKAVIIFNKNSSTNYNFSKILDSVNQDFLEKNNIGIKVTKSSTFASALYEIQKNKNNQIVVVGNYVALAEGIDMSCIDTGFYIGSLRESAETIQSFARQRNHEKESSNIYLGNNGLLERYKINSSLKIEDFTVNNTPAKSLTKALFKGNIELYESTVDSSIKDLEMMNYSATTSSIVLSTNTTLARLEAYEAVMSGRYPIQEFDYKKQSLLTYSDNYINKEVNKSEEVDIIEDISIEEEIEQNHANNI